MDPNGFQFTCCQRQRYKIITESAKKMNHSKSGPFNNLRFENSATFLKTYIAHEPNLIVLGFSQQFVVVVAVLKLEIEVFVKAEI